MPARGRAHLALGGTYEVTLTSTDEGLINVANAADSPYGAGWSVGGLQQLSQPTPGGPIVITAGQQGTERFDPVYDDGQDGLQDLALAWGGAGSPRVLANDGTGGFSPFDDVFANSNAVGAAGGDLDGDGWA